MVGTYIVSVIRYASPAWYPFINDSCKKRLLRFQCDALCSALGRPPLNSEDDVSEILQQCNQTNILDLLSIQYEAHWKKAATFNPTIRHYIIGNSHELAHKLPRSVIVTLVNPINEL